jgi:transposase
MYFKSFCRKNPLTGLIDGYYRLVESYRNIEGRICHRVMLNIGFLSDLKVEQLNAIQRRLTNRVKGTPDLFPDPDPVVNQYADLYWRRLVAEKRIDLSQDNPKNARNLVDVETIQHKQVREMGGEWLGYQCLRQLGIEAFLQSLGWPQDQIQLALTQIICRAFYPASELKTARIIHENSAICTLTGYPLEQLTKDKLYGSALRLYSIKESLEKHLSTKTNELFDLKDKIVLYDLTNTYFEGTKAGSALAKFGRSKEKRRDAKLVVLALVTNQEGFLKYSRILEGNVCEPKTLLEMVESLRQQTAQTTQRATVVLDAGVATEENLRMLEEKGYDYVCVSRRKAHPESDPGIETVQSHLSRQGTELTLKRVKDKGSKDYFLKVHSNAKKATEEGMKNLFEQRFEEELTKIAQSLAKKHGVKQADKVHQRIGRAKQKYPSVSSWYKIETKAGKDGLLLEMTWEKQDEKKKSELGHYFLRTNLTMDNEANLWDIYNTIREIESTFRCLKTDLDLRPIYHKNDDSTKSHLHLALLAYWLANTIRYQLKAKGIHHSWTEITRIASTQKLVNTQAKNALDQTVYVKACSVPEPKLKVLIDALGYKHIPFKPQKSVGHSPPQEKIQPAFKQKVMDG